MVDELGGPDGGFRQLQKMREEGVISAFGAGINAELFGEDHEKKMEWNSWYVNKLIKMHEGTGRKGLDFFLIANCYSLLVHDAIDNGMLDACHKAGV